MNKKARLKQLKLECHYEHPTEYELSKEEYYRKTADHKNKNDRKFKLIDTQDGVISHWSSTSLKLDKTIIKNISKFIEKWMDEDETDGQIEINVLSKEGHNYGIGFDKYIINFQDCANGCEQWMIVKCRLPGFPKIFSKHLGRFICNTTDNLHFVHNQVFSMSPKYADFYKKESSF
ncbi:MAG: hypothetical protein ABFD15_06100 [Methanofastidiosum sp.]